MVGPLLFSMDGMEQRCIREEAAHERPGVDLPLSGGRTCLIVTILYVLRERRLLGRPARVRDRQRAA